MKPALQSLPAIALVALLALSPRAVRGACPAAAALRLSDLPPGFMLDSARYLTNVQAGKRDHIPPTSYSTHGRLRTYVAGYYSARWPGLNRVDLSIAAYRTASGAQWDFARLRAAQRRVSIAQYPDLSRVWYRPMTISRIGDGAAAFTVDHQGDEFMFTNDVIIFRRGTISVRLEVTGQQGFTPRRNVIALARLIDDRLRRTS